MTNNDEKYMFKLIDRLHADEVEAKPIDCEEENSLSLSEYDTAALARIKERTLAQLIQEELGAPIPLSIVPTPRRRRTTLVAALIAGLLAVGAIGSIPSVQAELKKVWSFIPGIGIVQESEATQLTYILEKPYVQEIGDGKLIIDGIVLQPNNVIIKLRGMQTPEVKEFKAEIADRTYHFTSYMRSSSGDWYGNYSSSQDITHPAEEITLNINGTIIGPLKLVTPKTADELEQLGTSAILHDVTVTAFPTRVDDGLIRVQLISKLPRPSFSITSYGVSPLIADNGLYVEDAKGVTAELDQQETMSYPSDFRFHEITGGGLEPYTVVVPFIEVSDHQASSKDIVIPLPDTGVTNTLDVHTEISGFPVRFTHLERTGDTTVSIDVDVHFDPTKPKTLLYFFIRYPGSKFNNSFSWENTNDTYSVMKTLHLETSPGQSDLRFSLAEPHFLLKGPWRLPLNLENVE